SLSLASCDSKKEDAAEAQGTAVKEAGEAKADAMEEKADAVRDSADKKGEAIGDSADAKDPKDGDIWASAHAARLARYLNGRAGHFALALCTRARRTHAPRRCRCYLCTHRAKARRHHAGIGAALFGANPTGRIAAESARHLCAGAPVVASQFELY
nr:hypothetical protein [Tanacetum cinerariifolium]